MNYKENYIGIFDGLRGLMAFWVFYGHLKATCMGKLPILGPPALAVDVFMFLSGFLMTYHWVIRQNRFDSFRHQSYDFFIRRFFRIAPLYYLLLTIAFSFQNYLFTAKNGVRTIVIPNWAEKAALLKGVSDGTVGLLNVLSHYTFTFGFFPKYVASTVIPDWSIALEMQFYLVFPFLIMASLRYGYLLVVTGSIFITLMTNKLFGLYLSVGPLGNFPQPGLLLFKIAIFVSGMCFAQSYLNRNNRKFVLWIVLGVVSLYTTILRVKLIIFILLLLLFLDPERKFILHKIASGKFAKFLGDISYSVYLVHPLIALPMLALFFSYEGFVNLHPWSRFLIVLPAIAIPVYGAAFLLFHIIELPGIMLGRRLAKSHLKVVHAKKAEDQI